MKLTAKQREEWAREMPVLAAIIRTSYGGIGDFVKTTQFGDLYLDGGKYTLVTGASPSTQPAATSKDPKP